MLQRAASNAYTWWWASHIRTKQSKWLDNNLNDMEEKVKAMLKLIEEDADTFAKKAEMYYRRRPELIAFVEETYKSYRALAERYDHISGELHKANNTIATVFPDQVHFGMDEEDDDSYPKETTTDPPKSLAALPPHQQDVSVDGVQSSLHKLQIHKRSASQASREEEIDKLQKGILALQTEKEFVKSSYESGLAKYWDIDKRIMEMQEKICSLQDGGGGAATVIEDDEARALMAVTALKSCEDTLVNLHERQKKSSEEAKFESQRIKKARDQLRALKCRYGHMEAADNQSDASSTVEPSGTDESSGEEAACDVKHDRLVLHSVCENVKRNFEMNPGMSVLDLAEKIDGLVNKVIDLESTVSSQSAQIQSLRVESDELQKHLHSLEEEKMHLIDGSKDLSEKLRQAEEELRRVQDLDKHVRDEGGKLNAHFTEAYNALSDLSDRLQTPRKTDEEEEVDTAEALESSDEGLHNEGNVVSIISSELRSGVEGQGIVLDSGTDMEISKVALLLQGEEEEESSAAVESRDRSSDSCLPSWQQLFLDGLDDRERILLTEYTSILRNYKEAKRKLMEAEKKNQDHLFDAMAQMRDLKNANVMKDEEIHSLRLKLSFLEEATAGSSDDGDVNSRIPREAPPLSSSAIAAGGDPRSSNAGGFSHQIAADDESPAVPSSVEEKFRKDIDELLEENLEFWLRFSSSFQQIHKYKLLVQEIQSEIQKLRECKKQESGHHHHHHRSSSSGGSNSSISSTATGGVEKEKPVRPEATAIHNQLKELQTDLSVWIEQNALLKQELQTRFASLCNIKEEIVRVSREGGEIVQLTPHQAAKFQGEVLGMQQENNKVADELQAGLDHVKALQVEAEKALAKLDESFEITAMAPRGHLRNLSYRTRIPLRSFLFGVKPKPKKSSIFSCMNPALQKQYSDLAYGIPQ